MKTVDNLYETILDLKKLDLIYKIIRKNTKNKAKLENFENNYVSNMIYIKEILENKTYKPGKYNIFIIKEPKIRLIMSQNIMDKIINHLVSKYFLVDIFDKTLIDTNVATRKGKGTSYGIKKLKQYLNKIKGEEFYILKFDISKYFYNIDHDILKNILNKKIKDKNVINILNKIIDSTNELYINEKIKKYNKKVPFYNYNKGLPIGNMTSQILAILYLNELDHFIKEKLKIKYYIRYMDDGILIHKSKQYLQYCLQEIEKIIIKYKLQLNKKTKIYNIKNGFEFLGYRYYIKNNKILMKVKTQTKKRFKRKIKKLSKNNKISKEKYLNIKASYLGYLNFGNTSNLIYKTFKTNLKKMTIYNVIIKDDKLVYKKDYINYG